MEINIKNPNNVVIDKIKLPPQFSEEIREDLIKRAVLAILANSRQPYGADPEAGKKHSAKLSRRRRTYRGAYGYGISRVPRKALLRRGSRFYWVGAFAPGTVGGRRAHPPKAEKIWDEKINKKERRKAIRSALSATMSRDLVIKRGHLAPEDYPFALSDDFEIIGKAKDLEKALKKIGLDKELERTKQKKIRSGKGKLRGRRYKRKVGPLIVISDSSKPILKAAKNLPGVDVVEYRYLNAYLLAPGTHLGRLTLFTVSAIRKLSNDGLFLDRQEKKEAKIVQKNKEGKKERVNSQGTI